MIRLDFTTCSVVAVCDCGWRALALTRLGAWDLATQHERKAHPGRHQALAAFDTLRRRHTFEC